MWDKPLPDKTAYLRWQHSEISTSVVHRIHHFVPVRLFLDIGKWHTMSGFDTERRYRQTAGVAQKKDTYLVGSLEGSY